MSTPTPQSCPLQLLQFQDFLGQRVVLTLGDETRTGVLQFCGRSPLSRMMGTMDVTFTLGRFPLRVSPEDLSQVQMTLFPDRSLF